MAKTGTTLFLLTLLLLKRFALATHSANCTVSAAVNGTFDQSCNILCKPAKWNDLIMFYIGNYLAHAATIRYPPGEGPAGASVQVVIALLFPMYGLVEGIRAIFSLAVFQKTPSRTAARARALYQVVDMEKRRSRLQHKLIQDPEEDGEIRTKQPVHNRENTAAGYIELPNIETAEQPSESVGGNSVTPAQADGGMEAQHNREVAKQSLQMPSKGLSDIPKIGSHFRRKLHGRVSLPSGWQLVPVHPNAEFEDDDRSSGAEKPVAVQLSQNYSFTKSAIALGQSLYAISSLYDTRGNQIRQFGYASFGFTVIPYAFMSIVNLLGNLICPEYPAIYIVESNDLTRLRGLIASEGKESIFYVEGTVGKLKSSSERNWNLYGGRKPTGKIMIQDGEQYDLTHMVQANVFVLVILALLGIHVGLIGGLTHFHKADSTHAQRVWTMTWLGLGSFVGFSAGFFQMLAGQSLVFAVVWSIFIGTLYSAPAVGGFIVVGQMILQLGICEHI